MAAAEKTEQFTLQPRRAIDAGELPPVRVISSSPPGMLAMIVEFWQFRELLFLLIQRDILTKYKQTVIGLGWAVLQPLMLMSVFTVFLGIFAKVPSDNLPYALFCYSGLVIWQFFSKTLSVGAFAVRDMSNIISRVYFPRLYAPISCAISSVIDFAISLVLLVGLMLFFDMRPHWQIIFLPVSILLAFITGFAVALWLTPVDIHYRDVRHSLAPVLQMWMFSTPVVYPTSIVPENLRILFYLNPMTPAVEGFRWALFPQSHPPDPIATCVALGVLTLVLVLGLIRFRRFDGTVADSI